MAKKSTVKSTTANKKTSSTSKKKKKKVTEVKSSNYNPSISTGELPSNITKPTLQNYLSNNATNNGDDTLVNALISTNTNGIEGLPYQFLPSVDRRLVGTNVGRKYAERIFSRLPLLFLTPCEPMFMDDYDKQDANNILQGLIQGDISGIVDTVGKTGKYYSTEFAYDEYYTYLNTMLACLSIYLNLFNEEIDVNGKPTKIGLMNWQAEMNESFKTYFSSAENVIFYLDGMTSVSESFSNETTESQLASQINGFSDVANEIKFLFGKNGNVASDLVNAGSEITSSITSALSTAFTSIGGGIVGSLSDKGVNSVLNGGKIVFPEIWSNSSFDRSYSIDIKLRSPDHDDLSIFLNVLKPYCKILAMVLPRMTETKNGDDLDPNSYNAPFLVKAYSKGLFNVDMGIISGLSVTKGAECCWNDNGLPTQIDISIEIKDLYKSLSMSRISEFSRTGFNILKTVSANTSYQDFLANMAGLNIGQMEMGRRARLYFYLTQTAVATSTRNEYTRLERSISRLINKLYNTI